MPLMPKRVKFRKSQRGKIKGNAQRGNIVSYGEFARVGDRIKFSIRCIRFETTCG